MSKSAYARNASALYLNRAADRHHDAKLTSRFTPWDATTYATEKMMARLHIEAARARRLEAKACGFRLPG